MPTEGSLVICLLIGVPWYLVKKLVLPNLTYISSCGSKSLQSGFLWLTMVLVFGFRGQIFQYKHISEEGNGYSILTPVSSDTRFLLPYLFI